jgi:hypothetical protein
MMWSKLREEGYGRDLVCLLKLAHILGNRAWSHEGTEAALSKENHHFGTLAFCKHRTEIKTKDQ